MFISKLFVQIVALLLENGADVNARNIYGQVGEQSDPTSSSLYNKLIKFTVQSSTVIEVDLLGLNPLMT
jgi:ankyrin repeat protein